MLAERRFAYIDSARAVAAAFVVWQHTAELSVTLAPQVSNRWMADVLTWVDFGRIGVIAFFAISGYVIPSSLNPADRDAGRKFLIRRFFRLFPAYWLSIPIGFVALWAVYDRSLPLGDLLLNLTMLPSLFGAVEVIGLYWTLAYELAFYLLCLGLWRLGLLARPWTMLALIHLMLGLGAALLLGAIYSHRGEMGSWALGCFFFGIMFTGASWRQYRDGLLIGAWQRLALLAALLVWFVAMPLGCLGVMLAAGRYLDFFAKVPVGYAAGLTIFLLLTTVAKINWRPIAWIGLVSYSLYLFHPVVLYPLERATNAWKPVHLDLAAFMAVEFALSIALAAVVFYALERPAIALGRRLSGRPATGVLTPAEEVI